MPHLTSPSRSTGSGKAPKSILPGSPLLVLLAIAVIALAVAWSDRIPAPLGMEAPAGAFSAGRALAALNGLAGRGEPRPIGSTGHERGKDFLLAELKELGYTPELQEAVSFEPWSGNVARVQNVLTRLEGRESGAVMVTAHYDTVAAGPGAADDGFGVAAVLELARIFKQEPQPRYSVIFLFADGEESGMLGARAFMVEHPFARDVRMVLNIDSAGTSGRALMYETSAGNHWIIGGWRRAATRPYGSSTMYELYRLMPNNSDLTVYKEAGLAGLNFANIGNPSGYHTSLDDMAHASAGTLQDLGDQVLACARYFANAQPPAVRQDNDVYFDFFGLSVVAYPRLAAWLLALCATGLTVASLVHLGRRAHAGERQNVGVGFAAYLLGALAGAAGGMLASSLIKALTESLGPFHPAVAMAATAGLSLAAALTVYVLFARRAGRFGLLGGVLIWWNLYTLLTTVFVPGASYLWAWPCLGAACWLLLAARRRTEIPGPWWAPLLAVVPAALLWLPLLLFSPLLLSGPLRPLAVLPCSFLLSLAAPVLADGKSWGRPRLRWLLPAAAAAIGSIFAASILWSPPGNAERVQGHWLGYHLDTDLGRSFWIAPSGTPASVRRAFGRTESTVFWGEKVLSAPAPATTLPAPMITATADGVGPDNRRILKVRVMSPRRARNLHIEFTSGAGPVAVRLNGREYALPYRHLGFIGLPPEGMEIELIGAAGATWRATVSDISSGLPAGGERLLRARPDWAVPYQEGDGTVVTAKVNL